MSNYDELKEEQQQQALQQQQSFNDDDDDDETFEDDKKKPENLFAQLSRFFALAPAETGAYSGNPLMNTEDNANVALADRVWNKSSEYFDYQLFETISKDLLTAIDNGLKKGKMDIKLSSGINVEYDTSDDVLRTSLEQNIWHFSAAKTLAELQALNQAARESKDYAQFRRKADKITTTFNKRWQQIEYDTAIACAESASNYHRLISKKNLFPFWEYKTVGDDKVRPEHAGLNGKILPFNDPLWDEIFPPNGWKCRCYVVPRMKGEEGDIDADRHAVEQYKETKDWQNAKAQHWDVNRAKQNFVFDRNQMYIRKFPDNAASYMEKITPAKWGLSNSIKKLKQQATENYNKYKGTAEDWWNANKTVVNGKEVLAVEDYNGRTWYMEKKGFSTHTTDIKKNREYRIEYLNTIKEIMKNPDEVWLNRTKEDAALGLKRLSNYTLVKYYKNEAMAIYCRMEKGKLIFKTWFPLRNKRAGKGILIRKK